ncbi:glutathione S-transferase 4-like [Physella acuta]|uniref:glutathione S-transferase 4-like n=1 Tax=Physella acuta TaxID=109671 RepID=UPI0027DD7DB9|nr:glutathione S-transferase 4-like [Physella acuta]
MADAKLRLIYFDFRGRAEIARLLLAAAGKEYDDVRYTMEEWPRIKPTTPYGQVPVLEVDGVRFGLSIAIYKFLAREFNFYGKNNMEHFKIDEIVHLYGDFFNTVIRFWFYTEDEDAKNAGIKYCKETESPKLLGFLERSLRNNDTGYFVGDGITLADIVLLDLETGSLATFVDINNNYPLLKRNLQLVRGNHRIADYLTQRKEAPY